MSWLSDLFGGGKDEEEQKTSNADSNMVWPKIVELPQYPFTEPQLKLTSDFVSQNIERMMTGGGTGQYLPQYYVNAMPQLRESMARPLYETYYGRGGRPGVVRTTMDVGR